MRRPGAARRTGRLVAEAPVHQPVPAMNRAWALGPVVVALAAWPANAAAADPRATESFRQAQAAFERHDFAAAATAFELAAQFEPNARVLLDAADAWLLAEQPVRAAEDCDRALAMKDVPEDARAYAVEHLAQLANRIATLEVSGPATLSVTVDDGDEAHAPVRRRVAPGHHTVRLVDLASGAQSRQEIELAPGAVRRVEAPSEPFAPASAPPAAVAPTSEVPHAGRRVPTGAWIGAGASLVATGVAAVFGVMTLQARSDFDQNPTQGSLDAFYRDRAITNGAWGVAILGVATAIVLWATR